MAKGAFGQKQGVGALVMQWPKEEGSDFAGHEMAKEEDPTSLAIAWPKRATHYMAKGERLGVPTWSKEGKPSDAYGGGGLLACKPPPCDCWTRMGAVLWGPLSRYLHRLDDPRGAIKGPPKV
jgi:hypothetical protein